MSCVERRMMCMEPYRMVEETLSTGGGLENVGKKEPKDGSSEEGPRSC
jgi:hypothetical protein